MGQYQETPTEESKFAVSICNYKNWKAFESSVDYLTSFQSKEPNLYKMCNKVPVINHPFQSGVSKNILINELIGHLQFKINSSISLEKEVNDIFQKSISLLSSTQWKDINKLDR